MRAIVLCASLWFSLCAFAVEQQPHKILFLGDSFTVGTGLGKGHEQEAFPYQLIKQLKANKLAIDTPTLYAVDGDTTKHLLGALNASEPQSNPENPSYRADHYSLVVLSIGINDLFRGHSLEDYQLHFDALLNRAIHFANDDLSRVIVLSIPAWDASPSVFDKSGTDYRAKKYAMVRKNSQEISVPITAINMDKNGKITLNLQNNELNDKIQAAKNYNTQMGIANEIDRFNQAALDVIKAHNAASEGNGEILFVDLTELTRKQATDPKTGKPILALFAPDGIHYSGKMYQRWADVVYPTVYQTLENNKRAPK